MKIVDVGSGPPIVLVPGIQGRWEWMKPAVDALSTRCRVVTFSLADEPTCGGRFDAADGFACYVQQVADAMDAAGLDRATIGGVSYGGLVAAAFVARHPERSTSLLLVSALPPSWRPDARVRFFLRAPALLSPLFCIASLRMHREIAAATPGFIRGLAASARHGVNVLRHFLSPTRMTRRVRLLDDVHLERELQPVAVPTLIVTGDDGLDRVVPVRLTRDYVRLWPHATLVTLARTGHLGLITRPRAFTDVVAPFVERAAEATRERRRVV